MDLNPDQLIALGKLQPDSFTARLLEWVNRFILHRSQLVVALDRFMADRLFSRGVPREKMLVMPPWPHEKHINIESNQNPFRARHGVEDQFVIMYSGNHSPSNPLKTMLDAAVELRNDPSLKFLFIGGGTGKREVEGYLAQHQLPNVISLPYQPLADLKYSLNAADVHIISLGENMVGIIHPCKIYAAMAAGKPILFIGPSPSHISDLLDQYPIGIHVAHGDVPAAVAAIHHLQTMPAEERQQMGMIARQVLSQTLSQTVLCGQFCDAVETAFNLR